MKLPVTPESIRAEKTWKDSERFNNTFNLNDWCCGEVVGLTRGEVEVFEAPSVSACLLRLRGQTRAVNDISSTVKAQAFPVPPFTFEMWHASVGNLHGHGRCGDQSTH